MKAYLSIISLLIFFTVFKSQQITVNNINYQITDDNKAIVTKGNYGGNIVIPDKINFQNKIFIVETLGYDSFMGSTQLLSVKLPETIKKIDIRAFEECINLTSINLPKSLQRIETAVFFKCHQLKKIAIPENIKFISPDAFSYCSSLQ